jgi:serine phosphatase RsbU (regulator of sigma subunit)
VTLSVAGHPPPVLAEPGQPARLLDISPDLPLGAHHGAVRRTIHCPLSPGALMFFYTDGLIERRTRALYEGFRQLTAIVTPGPAETVCTQIMSTIIGNQPAADDIAILALRRVEQAA